MHGDENIALDVDYMLIAHPPAEDPTQYAIDWAWGLDKVQVTGILTTITHRVCERHYVKGHFVKVSEESEVWVESKEWYDRPPENFWALEVNNVKILEAWPPF